MRKDLDLIHILLDIDHFILPLRIEHHWLFPILGVVCEGVTWYIDHGSFGYREAIDCDLLVAESHVPDKHERIDS